MEHLNRALTVNRPQDRNLLCESVNGRWMMKAQEFLFTTVDFISTVYLGYTKFLIKLTLAYYNSFTS
jgi:hypothetical protein